MSRTVLCCILSVYCSVAVPARVWWYSGSVKSCQGFSLVRLCHLDITTMFIYPYLEERNDGITYKALARVFGITWMFLVFEQGSKFWTISFLVMVSSKVTRLAKIVIYGCVMLSCCCYLHAGYQSFDKERNSFCSEHCFHFLLKLLMTVEHDRLITYHGYH